MKRLICIALLLSFALGLAACGTDGDTATYYYVRRDKESYRYGYADAVIVGEDRDVSGHSGDLQYTLILYFHGPVSSQLKSPFPSGTTLEALVQEEDHLEIRLSGIVSTMEGTELTLACACLARTCFALTQAESVTISSEGQDSVSMTITRDSLMLVDDSAQATN